MSAIDDLIRQEPFGLERSVKRRLLLERLNALSVLHYERCASYRRILRGFGIGPGEAREIEDIPYLPVRLFKELELRSTDEVFRTLMSSGTTGQTVSRIYLDKAAAAQQSKALAKIVGSFIGKQRLPMLVIDCEATISSRAKFSARAAGILGFSMFGSRRLFALDEQMQLRTEDVCRFLEEHKGCDIFIFGFTFMVWQHLCAAAEQAGVALDLSRGTLIHGGGWKKLASLNITNEQFRDELWRRFSLKRVHDYYGMVEQTGTIHVECPEGNLHAPALADVIIRDPRNFSVAPIGQRGIVEVLSALPESYPGHALLTEDEGVLLGEDTCPCGRCGKYFKVLGRLANAELRGCSDSYAQQV